MAPFTITVAQTLEFKIYTINQPQIAINVLHYRTGALTPVMTSQDVLHGMDALLSAPLCGLLGSQSGLAGYSLKDVTPGGSFTPMDFYKATTTVGVLTGDLLPTQTALVVTKQTASAGRGYRGRYYQPFPIETVNDGAGVPTTGYVSDVDAVASLLFSVIHIAPGANNVDLNAVIRHHSTGSSTLISSWRTNRKWGTQRRRGMYGSPNVLPPELQ